VSFPVSASAQQIAILDPAVLKAKVLGRSIAEARTILEAYGQVTVSVSPDWTGSIPTFDSRVTLTIDQPVPVQTATPPAPTSTPTGPAIPATSGSPAISASP
jgi:hypothetical protein